MSLLEVILALGILLFMGGVVLGSFFQAIRSAQDMRIEAQGIDLASSVLAEVRLGILSAADQGAQPFDDPFADWTWELRGVSIEAAPGAAARMLEAAVRHKPSGRVIRMFGSASGIEGQAVEAEFDLPFGGG